MLRGLTVSARLSPIWAFGERAKAAAAFLVVAPAGLAMLAASLWITYFGQEAPAIKAVLPAADATDVSESARVQVSFDRPFPSAFDDVSLRLWTSKGDRIIGAFEVHSSQTAVMLAPNTELAPGKYKAEARIGGGEAFEWEFSVSKQQAPSADAGPILVIKSDAVVYDEYYAEILRAEGFTRSSSSYIEHITPEMLSSHEVVILTDGHVNPGHLELFKDWLEEGGNLIAMRPTGELATMAGLSLSGTTIRDGYLQIDPSVPPGQGLVAETIQFHGEADVAVVKDGASALAGLFSDASTPVSAPAVTIKEIGTSGGQIAAFTFDLAQSVALTRQGNPAWAGQERDGADPIRPNDLFFGSNGAGAEADFVDLNKVAIPQADEQMRILSNLITHLTRDTIPLPKFWYFPNGAKAVLVMAADDHGTRKGTEKFFERLLALGPEGCDVARWECARATSWMYTSSGIKDSQVAGFISKGFDIGAHANTHCHNWSEHSLARAFFEDLHSFHLAYPSAPRQQGSRLHCIVWSNYSSQPKVERGWGIRYDMNYYYWPGRWIDRRSGFMTGSGLPMRFSDDEGQLIDVYQQETHLVDEVFARSFASVEALINRALGVEGYYGAFGTHIDFHNDFDVQLMNLAVKRDVPMVSVQQMIDWTDGRSASAFENSRWEGDTFSFEVDADPRTGRMLWGMMPLSSNEKQLVEIRRGVEAVTFSSETIKGIEYGLFSAITGSYTATYAKP